MEKYINNYSSIDEIQYIDLKRIQDSLLRSIIEHKVNIRFIIEYYYIMMFNNHGNMSKEIIEQLTCENEIVKYILEYNSYEEYLQSNNISKDFDKDNKLKILNLKKLESALLRSIIERNVNYKFDIEYIYRKLILDDIESQQNLINIIKDKLNDLDSFKESNAFFTYILEFDNMEEYVENQKQLKK